MKTIDITQLKKPNILQIFFGTVISVLEGRKSTQIQNKIGEYTLVSEVIKKNNQFKKFSLGVYTDGQINVFIKTWNGKIKNMDYYSLINEIRTNHLLHIKFNESEYKDTINVPGIKNIIQSETSLSVVFEYIEGRPLYEISPDEQVKIIYDCIGALKKMSRSLTSKEKTDFIKRPLSFYIVSLPVMTILLIISQPKYGIEIIKSFFKSFSSINKLFQETLIIAHRDLNSQNILVKGNGVFLIDWERAALTLNDYDSARFMVVPDFYELKYSSKNKQLFSVNNFLKTSILIHSALDSIEPIERNHYLSLLT